ncbi:MAG: hypothetical protein GX181_05160 [Synergistaceae bacterium]|nr:hypothetical protein [Synergistaceae bacterium]
MIYFYPLVMEELVPVVESPFEDSRERIFTARVGMKPEGFVKKLEAAIRSCLTLEEADQKMIETKIEYLEFFDEASGRYPKGTYVVLELARDRLGEGL